MENFGSFEAYRPLMTHSNFPLNMIVSHFPTHFHMDLNLDKYLTDTTHDPQLVFRHLSQYSSIGISDIREGCLRILVSFLMVDKFVSYENIGMSVIRRTP